MNREDVDTLVKVAVAAAAGVGLVFVLKFGATPKRSAETVVADLWPAEANPASLAHKSRMKDMEAASASVEARFLVPIREGGSPEIASASANLLALAKLTAEETPPGFEGNDAVAYERFARKLLVAAEDLASEAGAQEVQADDLVNLQAKVRESCQTCHDTFKRP